MSLPALIEAYTAGPALIRDAVEGMNESDLDRTPGPGQWSTRQVVAHLADFEVVYAERFQRVLAEESPTLFGGDPDLFAKSLAYDSRNIGEELALIVAVRTHMSRLLRSIPESSFRRTGIHTEAGPVTLEDLLRTVTDHIPHHVRFIREKRARMSS